MHVHLPLRASRPSRVATAAAPSAKLEAVCRNIRVLANFQPPTTPEEIEAAALQYVRKVSGLRAPGKSDVEAFDRAVAEITSATKRLLTSLPARGEIRTRDGEKAKANLKWSVRAARIAKTAAT